MLGLGAFRRKPRQFSYKPVYFDPEKEEREERRRASEQSVEAEKNYVPGSLIHASRISRMMGTSKPSAIESGDKQRRIIIRLLIFLVLLFLLGYAMIKNNIFEVILSI